jgi:hypothetical protein
MSIQDFRAAMGDIPGGERLTMGYEDGGKVQVFSIDEKSVRVGPTATPAEVKEAFLKLE